jgi:two-component sensor histidine kinase
MQPSGRAAEREMAELLRHKEMLLQEMQHRIANSLQIIASILLRKARTAQSDETRMHLRDAHLRLMSVGAIQQQLLGSGHGDPVYIGPYLSGLSQALAALMTDNSRLISLNVQAEDGTASSAEAVSIGLIVAELVINAFKHAFVGDEASGLVVVAYEAAETSWQLTVSDNGIGMPEGQLDSDKPRPGLGTIIVAALAKQLDARVEVMRNRGGTTVSITHGTLDRTRLPLPLAGAETRLAPKSNGKFHCGRVSKRRLFMRASVRAQLTAAACHDLLYIRSRQAVTRDTYAPLSAFERANFAGAFRKLQH